jgi:DNA-binding CsgD family transcriptional regulator
MAPWVPVALPPRFAASRHAPIVGRRYELQVMEDVWGRVSRGHGQVVLLGGEPGAGKTRLAAEVAGALREHDVAVLVGTATKDAGVPYQPFVEMLDHLLLTSEPGSLAELVADVAPDLRRMSVHVDRHLCGARATSEPAGDGRLDLFQAVARMFRRMAQDRPLAVVLDDLQWVQLPTLALLEHLIQSCLDTPTLVLGAFRTTAPDRSDELSARLADLHRLDSVRRLDLGGLDTDAIAEFVCLHGGVPPSRARAPAAILRDRTGGNPFFLRETWIDLERQGGVSALRGPQRVPASLGDTLAARLAGLPDGVREIIELAAVLGDHFDLPTLVRAGATDRGRSMDAVDSATAVGLLEAVDGAPARYGFVHSLTRQAVLDRLPHARRTMLHARVAQALETCRDPALTPRIAHHYLAAYILGFHDEAVRHSVEAARQAVHSLAFEEAAMWFDRAATLPETAESARAELSLDAAVNHIRAGDFARARVIYERLTTMSDPLVRLQAAMGVEEANARPGLADSRPADLLSAAIADCGLPHDDLRHIRALGSLGRALAFAGRTKEARALGSRAIDSARRSGDRSTLVHTLRASLWHGLTPDVASTQLERSGELARMCTDPGEREALCVASYFRAVVSYLAGRPDDLAEATADLRREAESTGQPWHNYFAGCLAQGRAFLAGDFEQAEQRAVATLRLGDAFGVDTTDGSYGVQTFMIRRETGGLEVARRHLTGRESFAGRWVAGLLAVYTELGLTEGIRRTLRHLLSANLDARTADAQWPIELAFMSEGALAVGDREAAGVLRPFLAAYTGMNLVGGQFVAVFGSTDRYLAQVAALLGDLDCAERHFAAALAMDRRMGSVVHTAETLAAHALVVHAAGANPARARELAEQARALAEPIGQRRVLRRLEALPAPSGPDHLTAREVEVIELLAAGLSNREIGRRLYISANTAANHVRSILVKTGAANRTQAARYATEHRLV